MPFSEDGVPYGSIDMSKLDEVEAKSDEAKAQLEALKRDRDAGQAQAARDAKQAEAGKNQPDTDAEVAQLQAEAEKAGVTVDKRWGADRLRSEIASAQSAKRKG